MNLVPVIDLRGDVVVRATGGSRHLYQPIVSLLTVSVMPRDVVQALIDAFHPDFLYVADLDAIEGRDPALAALTSLRSLGVVLWIDAGVRTIDDVTGPHTEREVLVLGSETIAGPRVIAEAVQLLGADNLVFSLDLRGGRLLGRIDAWEGDDARRAAALAVERGLRRIVVLDLARVGAGAGTGTEELCRQLVAAHPEVEIYAGGGIRGLDDVRRLEDCGVAGVLVASALHDGRIRPEDWSDYQRRDR